MQLWALHSTASACSNTHVEGPRLCPLSALTGIYLVNYAIRSPGLEKTPGKLAWRKNSKHAAFSVPVIQPCRDDTDSQWKTVMERTANTIWQRTPHRTSVLCVVLNLDNFPDSKMFCKRYSCKCFKCKRKSTISRAAALSYIQFKKIKVKLERKWKKMFPIN